MNFFWFNLYLQISNENVHRYSPFNYLFDHAGPSCSSMKHFDADYFL